MILSIDDYTLILPKDTGCEITIDFDHYNDPSVIGKAALIISTPFIRGGYTHRAIGHIPQFEKIPLAIAIFLYLGKSFLVIDQSFPEVFADLVDESLTVNQINLIRKSMS